MRALSRIHPGVKPGLWSLALLGRMSSWRPGWQLTCSICSPLLSWPVPGKSDGISRGLLLPPLCGNRPLCSLHPWDARFLSSLVPFRAPLSLWPLAPRRASGYDPCHLLEPVLCSNSPTGS